MKEACFPEPLLSVILESSNIDHQARFYETALGFQRTGTASAEEEGLEALSHGQTFIALRAAQGSSDTSGVTLNLLVTNVEAWRRTVAESGFDVETEIEEKPWGVRAFTLRDPEGYRILVGQKAAVDTAETDDDLEDLAAFDLEHAAEMRTLSDDMVGGLLDDISEDVDRAEGEDDFDRMMERIDAGARKALEGIEKVVADLPPELRALAAPLMAALETSKPPKTGHPQETPEKEP